MSQQRPTLLKIIICFCLTLSVASNAECQKAGKEDVPHGANMTVELAEQKVSRLFGTVLFPNRESAGDIVIELYRRAGKQSVQETMKQSRLTACITENDGKFSFPELQPGRYLLRVGIRRPAGINELYVPVILKSDGPYRTGGLTLTLLLGT
jgi:hypothetical protein